MTDPARSESEFWDELGALHVAYDDDGLLSTWDRFKARMAEMTAEGGEAARAAERYREGMHEAAQSRGYW